MSIRDPQVIIAVVVLVLLTIVVLWGLLTGSPIPSPTKESPKAADIWSTPVVLTIGLLSGYVSSKYLIQEREPPGGIWTTLAAGVSGAWLGGALPSPGHWRWLNVNVAGSIILAFVLTVGIGRIGAHWYEKGR
ncbi:MAG: hypothetical protein GY832_39985 [Chloroflexi bacterium]|nr:hypothetical protein [Chloroflexota bacterium]